MSGVTASLRLDLDVQFFGPFPGTEFAAWRPRRLELEPGTQAIDQADLLYRAERTLAPGASEDLDFAGGVFSPLGAPINAVRVVALVLEVTAGAVRYGPAASGGALLGFGDVSDRRLVLAGDLDSLVCREGWLIDAGTADRLSVINAGSGAAVYRLMVIARSAEIVLPPPPGSFALGETGAPMLRENGAPMQREAMA